MLFKTPLPLPHPPKSLSSYYLGETICNPANVTVLEGCELAESREGRRGQCLLVPPDNV